MISNKLVGGSESKAIRTMGLWLLFFIGAPNAAWCEELQKQLAIWGSDHVGQELPIYVTGDECLFCHRSIGAAWPENPHQTTMRMVDAEQPEQRWLSEIDPAVAEKVQFFLGAKRAVRFLKRAEAYGKLDLLSTMYRPAGKTDHPRSVLSDTDVSGSDHLCWDNETFADRCIGCHTTATDSQQRTFAATSLDCYACHGEVDLAHTADVSKVLLSRQPQKSLVVNSICSSCHLRGGKSVSTGLPYPNTFVPGDNLFRDYQIDLSDETIQGLPAMQRHIYLSARGVGVGKAEPSCIDCHSVHGNSSSQHVDLTSGEICNSCHVADTENSDLRDDILKFDRVIERNHTCDY